MEDETVSRAILIKDFPAELWQEFKALAAQRGETTKECAKAAIQEFIEKHRLEVA